MLNITNESDILALMMPHISKYPHFSLFLISEAKCRCVATASVPDFPPGVYHKSESTPTLQTRIEVFDFLLLLYPFHSLHRCLAKVGARIQVENKHFKKSRGTLIPEATDGYICP